MARIDIVMPQMGESIAEGTLSKWLKKIGDEIKRDEPIFEISTDKVDAEIPAPSAGVLAEILVHEGQTVAVQTPVARLETEKGVFTESGTRADDGAGAPSQHQVLPGAPAAATPSAAAPSTPALSAASAGGPPPREQSAASTAALRDHLSAPAGSATQGGNGSSLEDRLRSRSSPLVRRIAAEHGVDLSALRGTGILGRVTKRDILSFIESGAATARASTHAPGSLPDRTESHGRVPEAWPGDRVEQMSRMRSLISDHMIQSRRTSAHVSSVFEVDFTRVARIRSRRRAEFEAATGEKLTFLPFVIASVVKGLQAFPVLNASVAGNNVIYRKRINVSVAVALDWGLIVPVIKDADNLSIAGITKSLNDLAARARAKKLSPEEVQEGTFTITNPGVFGSLIGTPIINQPQVAILCVGAIEKRPRVMTGPDGEDVIAIRTCGFLSLTFDHRIIDGAVADQFLSFVKKHIQEFPESGV